MTEERKMRRALAETARRAAARPITRCSGRWCSAETAALLGTTPAGEVARNAARWSRKLYSGAPRSSCIPSCRSWSSFSLRPCRRGSW